MGSGSNSLSICYQSHIEAVELQGPLKVWQIVNNQLALIKG